MTTTEPAARSSLAPGEVAIEHTSWDDPRVADLREEMTRELHPRYADLIDVRPGPPPVVDIGDIAVTLLALIDGRPVATTALKRTGSLAEVKRVFVKPDARRRGLASLLLDAIEDEARHLGYAEIHLQTGARQPEAMDLYVRQGWWPVEPFGPYAEDQQVSRCYAKALTPLLVATEIPASHAHGTTLEAVVELEAAGADLVLLDDDYLVTGALDAPTVASAAAPLTERIVLAPRVRTTHTEPFHASKAIQTLDWLSHGRAGWVADVALSPREAAAFGRREAPSASDAWQEAGEAIEVSRQLWDSWEDDAEIRDVATGRFIDRAKVHHIDFEGRWFSIKGPSIVPRSPQGRIPVIVEVSADNQTAAAALATAVGHADVIRVRDARQVARVREALAAAGREHVRVLADLDPATLPDLPHADARATLAGAVAQWRSTTGADGVLVPAETVATATAAGPRPDGATFREKLGLTRPPSRYARDETPSEVSTPNKTEDER